MKNSALRLVVPSNETRTVAMPVRKPNAELRTREYLTAAEVEKLIEAAKGNRWALRDATMILVAFRHGLRASELTDLRWDQIDFAHAALAVRRVKAGTPATHPIMGDELRALRRLQRERTRHRRSCSHRSAAHRLALPALRGCSNVPVKQPGSASKLTRICCAMPAASLWRTKGMIPVPCRPISAISRSSIPFGIRSWRRRGSRISGAKIRGQRSASPISAASVVPPQPVRCDRGMFAER
jgi:hypothetical protein